MNCVTRRTDVVILLFFCALFCPHDVGALSPYLELNQMLGVMIGTEISLTGRTAIHGSIGASPLAGFTVVQYAAAAVLRLRPSTSSFQVDIEAGMPLAYFNLLEDRCVDWDQHIDSPYAGWLFGGSVVWGYRRAERRYSLQTGYAAWWEWQDDDGWKGPGGIVIVSLRYTWRINR